MMKIKNKFSILTVLITVSFILSCNKDSGDFRVFPYTNGSLISCEGSFGNGNASISYYSNSEDSVYNDIFYYANNRSVGDVLQSITIFEGSVYLVVNNSNKVEVVDAESFQAEGVISGVSSPRYMVANGNTAYISCWGDNSVKIVDLNTNELSGSISTFSGPDKMLIQNDKLYIANSEVGE